MKKRQRIQDKLDAIPYDFETADVRGKYRVSSPKITAERGTAMCIDGALLAAFWAKLDPTILYLRLIIHGAMAAHAVLLVENKGKYGSIGTSRYPELKGREAEFDSIEELAASYPGCFAFAVINWAEKFPQWQDTEIDMALPTRFFDSQIIRIDLENDLYEP